MKHDPTSNLIDPADLPPEPVGEIPAFVTVPTQASRVIHAGNTPALDPGTLRARIDNLTATFEALHTSVQGLRDDLRREVEAHGC